MPAILREITHNTMSVTMEDVAKRAGVSKTTVSRIINGVPNSASEETIARVRKAIDDLVYIPNFLAASLKTLSTKTVGLIVGDIANPFFGRVIQGIEETLQESGFSLILANSGYSCATEKQLTSVLLERQVDAIIIAPCEQSVGENIERVMERGVEVILVDNYVPGIEVDHVVVDNFDGSYKGTEFLIEMGHRKLGMISGPSERTTASQRNEGFLAAMRDKGVDSDSSFVREGDYSIEGGYRHTRHLLKQEEYPTAIFTANNFMTVGALHAIYDEGLQVPKDISLLGFDDMYWYTIARPSLTAIAQPAYEIGQEAAKRILQRLARDKELAPRRIELKTELVVRESVAAPRMEEARKNGNS